MGKRGNGEGTIRELKNGYWEARIMIGRNENGKPKYKTFTRKQRAAVQQLLHEYIAKRKSEEPSHAIKQTVGQWLIRWYNEYVIPNVKTSTRVHYESIINRHLIPRLGHIALGDIKKTDIEAMYKDLLENGKVGGRGGLSVKSVKCIKIVLHSALEEALRREYILKNPSSIAKLPTLRSTGTAKKEIEILSTADQKKLMLACGNDVYGVAVFTALHTGVRIGELLGIQWDDIDFDKRTIQINKQVNRMKDYSENAKAKTRLGIQYSTKTDSSCRLISMSEPLAEKLAQYKEIQQADRELWGDKYNNLNMVFARWDGNYMDPATFRDKYRDILKGAGLKPFTVHALRHTFATRALEKNIPIKVVSNLLGHASVEITMDTYSHVLPELQHEAVNKIAEYYEEISQ